MHIFAEILEILAITIGGTIRAVFSVIHSLQPFTNLISKINEAFSIVNIIICVILATLAIALRFIRKHILQCR